jgi:hypothetical protein
VYAHAACGNSVKLLPYTPMHQLAMKRLKDLHKGIPLRGCTRGVEDSVVK